MGNKRVTRIRRVKKRLVFLVFLIKQELNVRKEQFFAVRGTEAEAIEFCRNLDMTPYCKQNTHYSAHFTATVVNKTTNESELVQIPVNYDNTHLLIKATDFSRADEGRTNNNPRWYWNISGINY